jgi:kynureninase
MSGTPPVLEESVGLLLEAGIIPLREKAERMSALLVDIVERECSGHGLVLGSPPDARSRGNHVIYHHPEAYAVVQALKARGVIGDFRMPDCIRLGIAPIYLSYDNIRGAVAHLRAVMEGSEWTAPSFRVRAAVT